MSPANFVAELSYGNISYDNGQLYYKTQPIDHSLCNRIRTLISQNYKVTSLLAFLNNLYENPSMNSVNQLYSFLENHHIPITDDGSFLAYKAVRDDYMDQHSGRVLNKIGEIVEMPRNEIDDNPNSHCSYGLHAGSLAYTEWYGRGNYRTMIVKINPRDVVSVPNDHDCQKLRTSRYEVVGESNQPLEKPVYKATAGNVVEASKKCTGANDNGDCCNKSDEFDFDYHKYINNSKITEVQYNTVCKRLVVISTEGTFAYQDVSLDTVEKLVGACKPNEYFLRYVKDKYSVFDVTSISDSDEDEDGYDCEDDDDEYNFSELQYHDFTINDESSWIESATYDPDDETLEVMLQSGESYDFVGVPGSVYGEFIESDSPGTYFNQNIKDNY